MMGRENPIWTSLAHNLGHAALSLGDLAKATEWLEQAADIREALYGPDDRSTLRSRIDLTKVRVEMNKFPPSSEIAALIERVERVIERFGAPLQSQDLINPSPWNYGPEDIWDLRLMRDFVALFEGPPIVPKARALIETATRGVPVEMDAETVALHRHHYLSYASDVIRTNIQSLDEDLVLFQTALRSGRLDPVQGALAAEVITEDKKKVAALMTALFVLEGKTIVTVCHGLVVNDPEEGDVYDKFGLAVPKPEEGEMRLDPPR